jgi:hypothetical protein
LAERIAGFNRAREDTRVVDEMQKVLDEFEKKEDLLKDTELISNTVEDNENFNYSRGRFEWGCVYCGNYHNSLEDPCL